MELISEFSILKHIEDRLVRLVTMKLVYYSSTKERAVIQIEYLNNTEAKTLICGIEHEIVNKVYLDKLFKSVSASYNNNWLIQGY